MNKKQSIALLFATWPRHDSELSMDQLVKGYEMAMIYCEPWAVERAVSKFIRGGVKGHNMAFRPTGPQVAELATNLQNEEGRIREITDRVAEQTKALPYAGPPKEKRQAQGRIWDRLKREFRKPNVHELAQEYVRRGISQPGTRFDIEGAHFPDGTHHTVAQMRALLLEPQPETLDHLDWQETMETLSPQA